MKFSRRVKGLLRQRILIILIILLQIAFVIWSILSNSKKFEIVTAFASAVSFFVALYVVNSRDKGAYKTSLVFLILLFPIFGGCMFKIFPLEDPADQIVFVAKVIIKAFSVDAAALTQGADADARKGGLGKHSPHSRGKGVLG